MTDFLDLDFQPLTLAEAAAWIGARGTDARLGYVVTPNVDHMVRLARAPGAVRAAYDEADLRLCDSRVLARIARVYGVMLPVVPGSDLVPLVLADVLAPRDRVCVVGGAPGMAGALAARYPRLDFVQLEAPMGLREDVAARAAVIARVVAAPARLILLAVGSPQQELLAAELKRDGRAAGTALCIGAAVEFLVGARARAPRVVQRLGLEWAWRLASEPRRMWRRYLVEGPAIFALARRWARTRAHARPEA